MDGQKINQPPAPLQYAVHQSIMLANKNSKSYKITKMYFKITPYITRTELPYWFYVPNCVFDDNFEVWWEHACLIYGKIIFTFCHV